VTTATRATTRAATAAGAVETLLRTAATSPSPRRQRLDHDHGGSADDHDARADRQRRR
jgi:hypothetical protein